MRRTAVLTLVLALPACGGGGAADGGGSGATSSSSSSSSSSSTSSSSGAPSAGKCSAKASGGVTADLLNCTYGPIPAGPPGYEAQTLAFYLGTSFTDPGPAVNGGGQVGTAGKFTANTTYTASQLLPPLPPPQKGPVYDPAWSLTWVDTGAGKAYISNCNLTTEATMPLCTGVSVHITTVDAAGYHHGTAEVTMPAATMPNPVAAVTIHVDF